jgi:hypothetical protein
MMYVLRCLILPMVLTVAWAQPEKPDSKPKREAAAQDLGPEHLRWVLTYPSVRPPSRLMIRVQPKDKPWLLKRFHHPQRLNDRIAATWSALSPKSSSGSSTAHSNAFLTGRRGRSLAEISI